MSVNLRIKLLREALLLNPTQFSAKIGVPRTTLLGWEDGKGVPIETAEKLKKAIPEINLGWLLSGDGQMFHGETFEPSKPDSTEPSGEGQMLNSSTFGLTEPGRPELSDESAEPRSTAKPGSLIRQRQALIPEDPSVPGTGVTVAHDAPILYPDLRSGAAPDLARWGPNRDVVVYRYRKGRTEPVVVKGPDPEGVVFIPIYNQTVSAGPGQEPTQLTETEGMMPVIFDLFGLHRPQDCGVVRVVGDSMTDITLSNGDWCIFDTLDRKGDGIFVISMFGETRVKRLQYRLADRKVVIASENNRRYPEPEIVGVESIEAGDLIIHGRVFSWLHKHPY